MDPSQQNEAPVTLKGEEMVFTFKILKFFLKLHNVVTLNPLLSSHFHLRPLFFIYYRSFQWASDVTES